MACGGTNSFTYMKSECNSGVSEPFSFRHCPNNLPLESSKFLILYKGVYVHCKRLSALLIFFSVVSTVYRMD